METIRRDLEPVLAGAAVAAAELRSPHCLAVLDHLPAGRFAGGRAGPGRIPTGARGDDGAAAALGALVGRRVAALGRRGKLLTLELEPGGAAAAFHLRMTGQLLLRPEPDGALEGDRHTHLVLRFRQARTPTGEAHLYLRDVRRFGRLYLASARAGLPYPAGTDALEGADDLAGLLGRLLAGQRAPVKSLLLDQRRLAGLGNIYGDEVLFAAGINPLRPGGSLAEGEVVRLAEAITAVLGEALAARGTTFSDYRDARGEPGGYAARLRVYRREGSPCRRCGTVIAKTRVGGRPTRYCPACQPELPRRGAGRG